MYEPIRKRPCKQASGKAGNYVLAYKDKKGKRHTSCHTSKKKAKGQIAAIEMREELLRSLISEIIVKTTYSKRSTFFRNPFEEPGEEFETDPDDPIGLVKLEKERQFKEELRGEDGGN